MFIRILLTAKYKVPGSNSSVTLLNSGDIIDHDDDYARFLISQGLAAELESEEPDSGEAAEQDGPIAEQDDDGLKIVTIVETVADPVDNSTPVGKNLEGKLKAKGRAKTQGQ